MSVRCAGCGLCYAGKRGPGGLAAGLRRGGGRFLRLLADVPRFHRAARALLNDELLNDELLARPRQTAPATPPSASSLTTAGIPATSRPTSRCRWSRRCGRARPAPRRSTRPATCSPSWPTTGCCRSRARRPGGRWPAAPGATSSGPRPGWPASGSASRSGPCAVTRTAPRCATPRARRTSSTRWSSPPTRTRPSRCSPAATPAEREVLGAFRYTPNPALLHTDARLLPDRAGVRAVLELRARPLPGHGRGADQLRHEPAAEACPPARTTS